MSTRKAIIAQVAREFGWKTGSISSGTATTAVLDGYNAGDDAAYVGDILWMPDAATAADQARKITAWDDNARQATFATRSDATYSNETFIIVPKNDLTLTDLNSALNDVLAELRQTVRTVLPTVPEQRLFYLNRFSWIRFEDDIDGVFLRSSPNMLADSTFDVWGAGASSAPSLWTLAGSGASVARATGYLGAYAARLTRAGTDCTLTQSLGTLRGKLAGEEVTMGCWVKSSTASTARIQLYDGATTTSSSYHTGGGGWEWLTVTATLAAAMTALDAILSNDGSDSSVDFSNAVLVQDSTISDLLKEVGDEAWMQRDAHCKPRQLGNQVAIEFATAPGYGKQLVVVSGQPYPSLTTDSAETDCPDSVLIHGTVDQAVSRYAKGQLRERYEALRIIHHRQFQVLSNRRRERPATTQGHQRVVMGA